MAEEIKAEIKQEVKEEKEQKPTLIDDADKAAERLEKANKEFSELLKRQEQLAAREKLGGRTSAGFTPVVESEEEKNKKRITEILKPTGFNPFK